MTDTNDLIASDGTRLSPMMDQNDDLSARNEEFKYFKQTKLLGNRVGSKWIYAKTFIRVLCCLIFVVVIVVIVLFASKLNERSQNKISYVWRQKVYNYVKAIEEDLTKFKKLKSDISVETFYNDSLNFLAITKLKNNLDFLKMLVNPLTLKDIIKQDTLMLETEISNFFTELTSYYTSHGLVKMNIGGSILSSPLLTKEQRATRSSPSFNNNLNQRKPLSKKHYVAAKPIGEKLAASIEQQNNKKIHDVDELDIFYQP